MTKHRPNSRILLRLLLTARFASFARQRSYGYTSSQGLTNRTRQVAPRYGREGWDND
jgi:hypothetical protein